MACGNGTAGAFAPQVLAAIGCEVVPLDCELDYTFPKSNPNPEDLKMLHAVRDEVLRTNADVGLAFDGDGDRCGVVDNKGEEIFADKVGVLLARDISGLQPESHVRRRCEVDGPLATDPVLRQNQAKTVYWKTGHSYMKRRVNEIGAAAGFEKSGHFFFNQPRGRGYDDGLISAIAICDMLDRNPGRSMAELREGLPKTWQSPTMAPHCSDERKYQVVDAVLSTSRVRAPAGSRSPASGSRSGDGRRRTPHGPRRHLGFDPRFLRRTGAGRRRRKSGVRRAHASNVSGARCGPAHSPGGRALQSKYLSAASSGNLRTRSHARRHHRGRACRAFLAYRLKRRCRDMVVSVFEQNQSGSTFGFGVVFSDRALEFLDADDPETNGLLTPHLQSWTQITVVHRGERIAIDGVGFTALGRLKLSQSWQSARDQSGWRSPMNTGSRITGPLKLAIFSSAPMV